MLRSFSHIPRHRKCRMGVLAPSATMHDASEDRTYTMNDRKKTVMFHSSARPHVDYRRLRHSFPKHQSQPSILSSSSSLSSSPLIGLCNVSPTSFSSRLAFFFSMTSEPESDESSSASKIVPLLTPSNISCISLIPPSTMETLKSLPEVQSVLDILDGTSSSSTKSTLSEAHSNLQRARDILQSFAQVPELYLSTYLIEAELHVLNGDFEPALDALLRYKHLLSKERNNLKNLSKEEYRLQTLHLQFIKSKLLMQAGQFEEALSEYEYILESLEDEVERQTEELSFHEKQESKSEPSSDPVPVIDGASALTGIGLSKLLLYHSSGDELDDKDRRTMKEDIYESLQTATEILLESREDALKSLQCSGLAIDLGLAASITLANLGVAHYLLHENYSFCKNESNTSEGKNVESIDIWKKGLNTVDSILENVLKSATIIPDHKFRCMESMRARLHCNIAWALLQACSFEDRDGTLSQAKIRDDQLKEASDAARKALEIYDGLINGVKSTGGGDPDENGTTLDSENDALNEEEIKAKEELKKLMEEVSEPDSDTAQTNEAISPLWRDYNRAESARALGLVAQCYAQAGAAVTGEGLFQSAMDASSSFPFGQKINTSRNLAVTDDGTQKGVSRSSPQLGLIARDVCLWYAALCDNWDKRKGDADRLRVCASKIENDGVLKGFMDNGEQSQDKRIRFSGLLSSLWFFSPIDFKS